MTQELQVTVTEVRDDGESLVLEINLHNPTERTLHAYATVRAIRYDPATQVVEVQLSDRGLSEPWLAGLFIRPRFTSIDPSGDTVLALSVPRVITRLAPGQNQISATFERHPVHEAQYVDVEVAWSGTPYYPDPRRRAAGPRAALVAWAQGFARHRYPRNRGNAVGPG